MTPAIRNACAFASFAILLMGLAPQTQGDLIQESVTAVEDIIVTARRSGAPVWNIKGAEGEAVLVGHIAGLRGDSRWNPEPLLQAASRADAVLITEQYSLSMGDLFKIKPLRLGRDERLHTLFSPELVARLEALAAAGALRPDWRRRHPIKVAEELRDRITTGGRGPDALSVILGAANKQSLPVEKISPVADLEAANRLATVSARGFQSCLTDAADAFAEGEAVDRARTSAWLSQDIQTVLGSALDRSYQDCGIIGPQGYGDIYREAWSRVLVQRLDRPGVTLAVVPLRYLAEPDGLLDILSARGFTISGPTWSGKE